MRPGAQLPKSDTTGVADMDHRLSSMSATPVMAESHKTITTDITVGAAHTYPSGACGFTDGCQTGISSGQESRCSWDRARVIHGPARTNRSEPADDTNRHAFCPLPAPTGRRNE